MEVDSDRLKRQNEQDFAEIVRTPAGMRFMAWLVELCGTNAQSFEPGEDSVNISVFLEGRRSIGLYLLSMIHSDGSDEGDYYRAVMERNALRRKDAIEYLKGENANGTGIGGNVWG